MAEPTGPRVFLASRNTKKLLEMERILAEHAPGLAVVGLDHVPTYDAATMETNVPGLYVAGTAIGGTQSHYKVFLENCHVHVERIVASLRGTCAREVEDVVMAEPES